MLSIEQYIYMFYPVILTVIVMLFVRIVLVRLLSGLVNRGVLTLGTKLTLVRVIDMIVLLTVLLSAVQLFARSLVVYVLIVLFGSVIIVLFYYEIREFTAYISLQLLRYVRGRSLEIYLPGHQRSVTGKIVSIEPFSSIIEDIYGNRIYVANSLLVNSVIREYVPALKLIVTMNPRGRELDAIVSDLREAFRRGEVGAFRLIENQITILKASEDQVRLGLMVTPLSIPIRINDVVRLIDSIKKMYGEHGVVVEIIE